MYAYAFLYPGQQGTPPRGIDPRPRWAVDLYNQSLTQAAKSEEAAYAVPMGGKFKLPSASLPLANLVFLSRLQAANQVIRFFNFVDSRGIKIAKK